jgi:hypothetical protein
MALEEAEARVDLQDHAEIVENYIVMLTAFLEKMVEIGSPYTRAIETDIHTFVMDGTMVKSKITAMVDEQMPIDTDNINDEVLKLSNRWGELRTISLGVTSSADNPGSGIMEVSDDDASTAERLENSEDV